MSNIPVPKDPVKYKQFCKNISAGLKQYYSTHPGVSNPGWKQTEEAKQKISATHKGKPKSPEHREKIRNFMMGKTLRLGKTLSPESRLKISSKLKGTKASPETRKKLSEMRSGDKHYNWQGGKSFEPYCVKFNNDLRERVRRFFNYTCMKCGRSQTKLTRKLDVHHVNFDKMVCCNDVKPLFVPLCLQCHTSVQHDKEYWEKVFTEMILTKYNGRCYVEKIQ